MAEAGAEQSAGQWLAAAASVDITPDKPVPLAGWTSRTEPWTRIADRLEANLLSLRQGDQRLLWITFDLLYVGAELRRHLEESLGADVRPEQLFLCASHTHFAPPAETTKPALGAADPAYLRALMTKTTTAAKALLAAEHVPATVRFARGRADHSINRRLGIWAPGQPGRRAVIIAPNPAGPRDETLSLLRVEGSGDRAIALVWHYACHPVGFPDTAAVSADFPGTVRARLRDATGNLPVLFCQGFSGDIRPGLYPQPSSLGDAARKLIRGSRFGKVEPLAWMKWAMSLSAAIEPLLRETGALLPGPLRLGRRESPLTQWVAGAAPGRVVSGQTIELGAGVAFRGVSAEPVVAHALSLQPGAIGVGCIDDVYGYLPTDAMLAERGYEVEGFLSLFGLPGPVLPGNAQRLVALLDDGSGDV